MDFYEYVQKRLEQYAWDQVPHLPLARRGRISRWFGWWALEKAKVVPRRFLVRRLSTFTEAEWTDFIKEHWDKDEQTRLARKLTAAAIILQDYVGQPNALVRAGREGLPNELSPEAWDEYLEQELVVPFSFLLRMNLNTLRRAYAFALGILCLCCLLYTSPSPRD